MAAALQIGTTMTDARVLIADDEPLARRTLRDHLACVDWIACIDEVGDGFSAIRAVDALRGRLALAAGLAFLGDSERAMPIFDQARTALQETMTLTAVRTATTIERAISRSSSGAAASIARNCLR